MTMTDSNATERLRELLDERGEKWRAWPGKNDTIWSMYDEPHTATESIYGTLIVTGITPEQAVAATLGAGECENLEKRNASLWFVCSKCGAQAGNGTYSEEWMHQDHTDEECAEYDGEPFNYCPNCGKAVER